MSWQHSQAPYSIPCGPGFEFCSLGALQNCDSHLILSALEAFANPYTTSFAGSASEFGMEVSNASQENIAAQVWQKRGQKRLKRCAERKKAHFVLAKEEKAERSPAG